MHLGMYYHDHRLVLPTSLGKQSIQPDLTWLDNTISGSGFINTHFIVGLGSSPWGLKGPNPLRTRTWKYKYLF